MNQMTDAGLLRDEEPVPQQVTREEVLRELDQILANSFQIKDTPYVFTALVHIYFAGTGLTNRVIRFLWRPAFKGKPFHFCNGAINDNQWETIAGHFKPPDSHSQHRTATEDRA